MDKQVVFKTSAFGGFEKKSVLDYIYQLNESAEEAQSRLEEQLAQVTESRQALDDSLREANAKMQRLQDEYDSVRAELDSERQRTSEMVEHLNQEIERQQEIIRDKDAKLQEYMEKTDELENRTGSLESKRREIENASAKIGRLLIDAHSDADNILDDARADAERVLASAKSEADSVLTDAQVQASRKLTEAAEEASRLTGKAQRAVDTAFERFGSFRKEISDIQRTILESLQTMSDKAAEINDAIDGVQGLITDGQFAGEIGKLEGGNVQEVSQVFFSGEDSNDGDEDAGAFFRLAAEN